MEIGAWEIAAALIKAVGYAATLSAAGAVFLLAYGASLLSTREVLRIRREVMLLSCAAVTAALLKVLLLSASMSGDAAGMFNLAFNAMILRGGEGLSAGLRLLGLGLACGALILPPHRPRVAVAGAMLAAGSYALSGHVHALPGRTAATLLLILHLLCAAFWIGALAPLRRLVAEADAARSAALAARFGNIAVWLVGLLVAAGATVLAQLLASPAELWRSGYGRLFSVKLALVAGLLGCAAFNKLHLTPALLEDSRTRCALRRSILIEMLLAAAILLVTALFTSLVGP